MGQRAVHMGDDVWAAAEGAALEAKARHVLVTLAGLAGLLDSVVTSERELAELTGFSRSVVWHRLHRLEDLGWLHAERIRGARTIFTLRIPESAR